MAAITIKLSEEIKNIIKAQSIKEKTTMKNLIERVMLKYIITEIKKELENES